MNWKGMEGQWWNNISVDMRHPHCYLIRFLREQGDGKASFEMLAYIPQLGMTYLSSESIANLKNYKHYVPMNIDLRSGIRTVFGE
jgi:hypothetical protein